MKRPKSKKVRRKPRLSDRFINSLTDQDIDRILCLEPMGKLLKKGPFPKVMYVLDGDAFGQERLWPRGYTVLVEPLGPKRVWGVQEIPRLERSHIRRKPAKKLKK